jgi:hypothetical protein
MSIDLKTTGILFAARALESVNRWPDPDFDEPDIFQHFLPGCARQTTGNSSRPKVDILDGRFRYRLAVGDIGKLKMPARA